VVDAVAETVNTTPITTGTLVTPSVIITDSSLNRLYVSNTGNNTVSILDASSSALPALNIVTVGTAPVSLAVTPDGASVYVANTGSNFASVINANSFNTT
jgi:YVTN family beta-propeller protein